jgi:DNA-directed RNA polymerase specialized sigma24 family protein
MLKDEGVEDLPKDKRNALRKANKDVDRLKASYKEATNRRKGLIIEYEAAGFPRSQIADALGITVPRVQQIVGKVRRSS